MPKRTGHPNGPIAPWKAAAQKTRREAAEARQAKCDALTPEERLRRLDQLKLRAVKERAKLKALIAKAS